MKTNNPAAPVIKYFIYCNLGNFILLKPTIVLFSEINFQDGNFFHLSQMDNKQFYFF